MEERAEDDEDVPDAVIIGSATVAYEEVDARGVAHPFGQDEGEG
jgi:hypothetical protein